MHVDYIIVGQGIAGTMLSHELVKKGKNVLVIDNNRPDSSSKVASGLINPVTGKRHVKSWLVDELLPVAINSYHAFEQEFDAQLLKETKIIDMFASRDEAGNFANRLKESEFLQISNDPGPEHSFRFNYGLGNITPCYLVDLQLLLQTWRNHLIKHQSLLEEEFQLPELIFEDETIAYKRIKAQKIIFCGGVADLANPYFSMLPFSKNKGEALIVSVPELTGDTVYKQGIKMAPWKNGLFWVGSSFDWKYDNTHPTSSFRNKIEEHLKYWLKLPFEVVGHIAAERPSTVDYKPFVGIHPKHPALGIFNGMGTKGCSQAPYFAKQFADHLVSNAPIDPQVDINRFSKILSRTK